MREDPEFELIDPDEIPGSCEGNGTKNGVNITLIRQFLGTMGDAARIRYESTGEHTGKEIAATRGGVLRKVALRHSFPVRVFSRQDCVYLVRTDLEKK